MEPEKTLGEKRIRTSFNVAEGETRSIIDVIKTKTAELIDLCQTAQKYHEAAEAYGTTPVAQKEENGERFRLIAIAQTKYEEACMYAVKAATA